MPAPHFPIGKKAFLPDQHRCIGGIATGGGYLFTLKSGKMIEFLLALFMASNDTGGDTGPIPPVPPPHN